MAGKPNIAAEIELTWADGTYLFALKLKQIEELQRLCNAGLGEIAQRLLVERREADRERLPGEGRDVDPSVPSPAAASAFPSTSSVASKTPK